MFDIGMLEFFAVALIALLVLGPERLPSAARETGKWIGKAKRMAHHWSTEINRQIENEALQKELREQANVKELEQDLGDLNKAISQSLGGSSIGTDLSAANVQDESNKTSVTPERGAA